MSCLFSLIIRVFMWFIREAVDRSHIVLVVYYKAVNTKYLVNIKKQFLYIITAYWRITARVKCKFTYARNIIRLYHRIIQYIVHYLLPTRHSVSKMCSVLFLLESTRVYNTVVWFQVIKTSPYWLKKFQFSWIFEPLIQILCNV